VQEESILRSAGLRATPQRRALVRYLLGCDAPVTAEEICQALAAHGTHISAAEPLRVWPSTVYRTLELLTQRGLTEQTAELDGRRVHELAGRGHHHYMVCLNCHEMQPFSGCPLEIPDEQGGFEVTGHRLELYGYCAACRRAGGRNQETGDGRRGMEQSR